MHSRFRSVSAPVFLALLSATSSGVLPAQPASSFNLPAQSLADSLRAIAGQTNSNILFDRNLVAGRLAQPLKEQASMQAALEKLLSGTGLTYQYLDDRTVTIIPLASKGDASGMATTPATSASYSGAPLQRTAASAPAQGAGDPVHLAQADEPSTAQQEPASELAEVVVTGFRFFSQDTTGASLLPLPIEDIPQSITLVNGDFLEALHITALDKLAEYTPGMVNAGRQGLFYDNLKIRGFGLDGSSGYKLDGFHHDHVFDYDPAFLERIEIIRGPSSVIYGEGSPGGLINQVLKKAPDHFTGRGSLQAGSWNTLRAIAELGGPVTASGNTRMISITTAERGDSFINEVDHRNVSQYLRIESDVNDRVSLNGLFVGGRGRGVLFDGQPINPDGTFPDVPRDLFIGDPRQNHNNVDYRQFIGRARYHTPSGFDLNLSAAYAHAKYDLGQVLALSMDENGDAPLYGFDGYNSSSTSSLDLQMSQTFTLFSREDNIILFSANRGRDSFENLYYGWDWQGHPDVVNIFQSQEAINAIAGAGRRDTSIITFQGDGRRVRTVYTMQSVLKPLERVQVISGISVTRLRDTNNLSHTSVPYKSETTVRGGLVYEAHKDWNLYSSYSESYNPQSATDQNGDLLPPSSGKQYEAGFKGFLFGRNLFLSGAAFQIDQSDLAFFVTGSIPEYSRTVKGVRHKGFELEAAGNITPNWTVRGGVAYLDARIHDDGDPTHTGLRRNYMPRWSSALSSTYEISGGPLAGFGFGGGIRSIGAQTTSFDGSTGDKPSYEVFDAVIYYGFGSWQTRINIDNLFDRHYYLSTYESPNYSNIRGTQRSVFLTVQKDF